SGDVQWGRSDRRTFVTKVPPASGAAPGGAPMVIVMSPAATDEDIAHVIERVESTGGQAFVSKGVNRAIIGLIGDLESFHHLNLRTLRGVAAVHRISDPYKLVSRQHHPQRSTVWVGTAERQVPIGPDTFTFIAGPC